jgi:ketosteroid isomerase-like protein
VLAIRFVPSIEVNQVTSDYPSDSKERQTMAVHTELSPTEAADRLALRELFDAYAHCADRRDAEGQKALFTDDTVFVVHMEGEGSEPTYVLEGREALTPVFADLNRYEVTTHFNGQSTVTLEGDRATGESYTLAHHLYAEDGSRKIMVASLRYLDTFAKIDGGWYFAERKLILDWSETRTIGAPTE